MIGPIWGHGAERSVWVPQRAQAAFSDMVRREKEQKRSESRLGDRPDIKNRRRFFGVLKR